MKSMAVKCPVCYGEAKNSTHISYGPIVGIIEDYNQNICVCKECGHIFTSNPIEEELLINYYKNLSKYEGEEAKGTVSQFSINRSIRQYDFIKSCINDFHNVLEVGASTGFNLDIYKKNGYDVFGIEPSHNNKLFAKNNYNIDMFAGSFDEYYAKYNDVKYDLIFMSHVLEHIIDPLKLIQLVKNINSKYVFIEVPSLYYKKVYEPFGAFTYEHVSIFTTSSLTALMNKCGYRLLKMHVYENANDGDLENAPISSIWCKDSNTHYVASNTDSSNSTEKMLIDYIRTSNEILDTINCKIDNIDKYCNLAVWCAGIHTSRLLGITDLKNKNIVKYYDSDYKKAGYKIYGKLIEKFDIDDIKKGLIDTILISSFSSEPSIKRFIEGLDVNVNIINLYD